MNLRIGHLHQYMCKQPKSNLLVFLKISIVGMGKIDCVKKKERSD